MIEFIWVGGWYKLVHITEERCAFIRNGQTALLLFLVGAVTYFYLYWPDGLYYFFCVSRQCLPIDVLPVGKRQTCDVPLVPTISLLCQVSAFISTYAVHPAVNSPSLLTLASSRFSDFPLRIKTATLLSVSDSISLLLRTVTLRTGVFRASVVVCLPRLQ